jgi:hypothetical protein
VKRPETKRPSKRSGNIRDDLSESQLAGIGLITVAYNEVELLIDVMIPIAFGFDEGMGQQITSRINGVDGKIEIIKSQYRVLGASREVLTSLSDTLGEAGFALLKKYRDGIIHARVLDAPLGIGHTIAKRGKFEEILLTTDALEGVYKRLEILRWELIHLTMMMFPLIANRDARRAYSFMDKTKQEHTKISDAILRKHIEQETLPYLSQYHERRRSRQSLPPLPGFPDESPTPPPTADALPAASKWT